MIDQLREFAIEGIRYRVDDCGVVHEDPPVVTQVYDREYVASRYDVIPEKVREMSLLRIGWLVGSTQCFQSVLDVGYGNGDFLAALGLWPGWNVRRYGSDVSGYPIPEGCSEYDYNNPDAWIPALDLLTLFDSLEHIPDLGFIRATGAEWVAITAPWYPGVLKFAEWKHRRPGEHLHHFTPESLMNLMYRYGYKAEVRWITLEDGLRPPGPGMEHNTFTALYRRGRY